MEMLGTWLKQVILVVILATFADMLLPNQTFRKYARTVLSLFVLLVLLSPLVKLFQGAWDERRLMGSVENLAAAGTAVPQAETMPALEAVFREAERLKRSQEQRTAELVEARIADLVRGQVAAADPAAVPVDVRVRVGSNRNGEPELQRIEVVLAAASKPAQAGAGGASPPGGLRVEPVRVEPVAPANPGAAGSAAEQAERSVPAAAAPAAGGDGIDRLRRELASAWALPPDRIDIRRER
ncbi:hypothetical protein GCM10027018_10500 [Paenibacillus thermoaerophilus]